MEGFVEIGRMGLFLGWDLGEKQTMLHGMFCGNWKDGIVPRIGLGRKTESAGSNFPLQWTRRETFFILHIFHINICAP